MKKKLLNSMRMLLVAAGLLVGGNAWATDVPYTVGATDYSTGYLGAKSDAYDLNSDGTWTFEFTNYNNVSTAGNWDGTTNPTGTTGWNGYVLNGTSGTAELFNLRCDNWENISASNTNCTDTWSNKGNTFAEDLNGATVNMTVTRSKGTVSVNATITPTTAGHEFTKTYSYNIGTRPLKVSLSVDNSYLTINSANFVKDTSTGAVSINAAIDFSTAVSSSTASGAVSSFKIGNTGRTFINDGHLSFGNTGGTVALVGSEAGTRDVVTVSFSIAWGKLSGKEAGFKLSGKNAEDEVVDVAVFSANAYSGTISTNDFGIVWNDMNRDDNTAQWSKKTDITITVNFAAKTITTTTACTAATNKTNSYVTSIPAGIKSITQFALTSNYANNDRNCLFDDLLIYTTIGDYSVATAKYTVKYKCGGVEVKTADVREGDVDATISLLAEDRANFFNGDESKRYIYVSDDSEGMTVESDNSTIVTVTFREAVKYDYTVTTSYTVDETKHLLEWNTAGSVWEDLNSVYVQIPRFQAYNTNTLVEAPYGSNGTLDKNFNVTSDDFVQDYAYSSKDIDNLYLLSEAEELSEATGLTTSNSTGFNNRCSNAAIAYGSSGKLFTLPAGKYKVTLGVIGRANSGDAATVTYVIKKGDDDLKTFTCNSNLLTLGTTDEFVLAESTDINFTCDYPATGRGIDLVYVQRTGDATVPVEVTDAGWATLYTVYPLNFSGTGLTAYTATLDGSTVTLTEVENVPANTGVVLKGSANTYNIPVIASSTTAQGDLTGNATAATAFNAFGGYDLYMLAKNGEGKAQFTKVTSGSIAAGKAFLKVSSSSARVLNVVFDNETTGISATLMNGEESTMNNVFDLQGRRVAAPQKGLYIVNGKKVVIK